jgi:hypothetical protein
VEDPPKTPTPRLPADRAFVVQVADAPEEASPLRGRAEHLASGSAEHFESLSGLGDFIARVLERLRSTTTMGGSR